MKTFIIIVLAISISTFTGLYIFQSGASKSIVLIKLDQELLADSNRALNSSTQSVNRYHSVLRKMDKAVITFSPKEKQLRLGLQKNETEQISFERIDASFLLPKLPYAHASKIDAFDKANLLLAEFARNGINVSLQEHNSAHGFVKSKDDFFNNEGEYLYANNTINPNPGVRPLRMSLVNNCLRAGLWEINASDGVGEMYHAWFELPDEYYFKMIKQANNISNTHTELKDFFQKDEFKQIPVKLDRLRKRNDLLLKTKIRTTPDKMLGGYSSQDSRRKVQRKFYEVYRGQDIDTVSSFDEMNEEHTFRLFSFTEPGVYDNSKFFDIPYHPKWESAEIYEVDPLTSYGQPKNDFQSQGSIEIVLSSKDNQQIIAGNIPISLLVFSADYIIPAFGAGVLSSSELIERRHLRLREGPMPHYAYLAETNLEDTFLLNNHEVGFEQIYLRPVKKNDNMVLRLTIVSYERIVDLMEFEIPITGKLKRQIQLASDNYQPPTHEVYSDNNVL